MIDLDAINLNAAKAHFALANVPSYIARKLRDDPAIVNIAVSHDSETLLKEFSARVAESPTNLREQVYPFALAVSIAVKRDITALNHMAGLDLQKFGWLSDMISGLIEQQSTASTDVSLGMEDRRRGDLSGTVVRASEAGRVTSGLSEVRIS